MNNVLNLILDYMQNNYELIFGAMGLIEILLRLIPTKKNRSIIDNVVKVIGFVIKNRRKPDPLDKVINTGKNVVEVPQDKFIL